MELVRKLVGDLVEDVRKFDEFIYFKSGRKSNVYRIVYCSLERILKSEEVLVLYEKVWKVMVDEFGVEFC